MPGRPWPCGGGVLPTHHIEIIPFEESTSRIVPQVPGAGLLARRGRLAAADRGGSALDGVSQAGWWGSMAIGFLNH